MEISKPTKIKIIMCSVMGILVLISIYIIVDMFSPDDKKTDKKVSIAGNNNSEFTYNDMLNVNEQYRSSEESQTSVLSSRSERYYNFGKEEESGQYQTEDPDILRLQQALREDNSQPMQQNNPVVEQVYTKVSEVKKVVDTKVSPAIEKTNKEIENPKEKAPVKDDDFFYNPTVKKKNSNSVPAVVIGDQVATQGSTIRFQLIEDLINEDGVTIPKGTYIYAVVSFSDNRLQLKLQTVRLKNNIYTISQEIYSSDGIKGVEIDESTKAKLAKQAKAGAIQNADVTTENKGIVDKGINVVTGAAKSVLSRENEEIKVNVKSNTRIYLK